MNRRTTGRYLALLTCASIVIPLARPSSLAAPLISAYLALRVLLMLTPVYGRHPRRNLGPARTGASWPVALALPAAATAFAAGTRVLMRVSGGASKELHALRDVDARSFSQSPDTRWLIFHPNRTEASRVCQE